MTDRLRLSDHNRRWWTLAAMCFALFMIMLDNTVVNVALPSIQRDFGASLSALEWTLNAYTLTFAVLLVTGGRLGDIFGRRRMFLFGVVVFAVASATIGFAPTEGWLVASRAVQGIGAAFMMPGTLSIIANAFPPEERGKAIGTWAGVSAIALALGPLIGGWLTEDVSWRAIFFLNLPVAVGAVIVTLFAAEESRDETVSKKVDLPGIATLTISLTALVLGLVEGNAWGWGSPAILGLFATAVVAGIAFAAIERRSPVPIVDFDTFRSAQFLGANIVAFMVTFGMFAMFFFLALYMQNILGFSPLEAGVRFLPSTLVIIVTGPIAGRLSDRIGPRPLMVAGLLIVAVSLFWQSRLDVDTGYGFLLPAFVLMGLGMGLVMSPMSTAALNAVDRTKAGVASGTLSMFRMVGGTFGIAALGALVAAVGRHDLAQSLPGLSEGARERLIDGLGSGAVLDGAPQRVIDASNAAFVDALSSGLLIAAVAVGVAALLAWLLIPGGPPPQPVAEPAGHALEGEMIVGPEPQPAGARAAMGELDGAVALVTGASSGIGRATARELAAQGAGVALVARRADRLEELAEELRAGGATALAIEADVTERAAAEAAVARAVGELGRLDILINNAGVMLLGPIADAPVEEWERMVQVNVLGLLYCAKAALGPLLEAAENAPRGVADLVNVSSVAGRQVRLGSGVYNATKHAVGAFSESLRQEVTGRHVRVSLVEPGAVATELAGHNRPAVLEGLERRFADMERLEDRDIADAIAYVVTRPRRVAVNEILVRPTEQQQ